jgi:hypothetical protein
MNRNEIINSCTVETGHAPSLQPLAQRSVDAMPSGAVRLRAESPVINSTGQRPVGEMPSVKRSPERAESGYLIRCRPFRAMGTGSPLFTGRCPVLLMTGLSALNLTAMAWTLRRAEDATPSGGKMHPMCRRHNMLVEKTSCTISPPVPSGTECVSRNIVPNGTRRQRFPNTAGRCLTLMNNNIDKYE